MGIYAPRWSIEEYEAREPERLNAQALQENQFYFLGLPNRTGYPDAYRALVQVEDLQKELGSRALGVRFYTTDLLPHGSGMASGVMQNNFWLPNYTLRLVMQGGNDVLVDKSYFLPYESLIDTEFKKVKEALEISDLLDNYV